MLVAKKITEKRKKFENGRTVAGTRENYCFKPINEKRVVICKVSIDTVSFIVGVDQSADYPSVSIKSIQPGDYVACIYDNKSWIGNIDTSSVERDALVSFMHAHRPV